MAGVVLIVFFLFHVLPADPSRMMLGQRADSASVAVINRDLGLDQPPVTQLLLYLNDLSPVSYHSLNESSPSFYDINKYKSSLFLMQVTDESCIAVKTPYLRRSYQTKTDVGEIIMEKLPDTVVLAFSAIMIATILGLFLGVISALNKDKWIDRLAIAISVSGVSLPSFFASILFAWLFGFMLSAYTGLNMTGGLTEVDPFKGEYISWKNLVLPALVLGLRPLSVIVQLTRSTMLEVLSQDYIRTARAKGQEWKVIVGRHAFRNALNPVVTAISGWLGSLLAGAVFVEFVFGWNGLGKLTVTALENYDMPVVMGIVLFISFVFILINIISDLLNSALDPRIKNV